VGNYGRKELYFKCNILFSVNCGCQWRMLPHDFPNWKTVYHYFRKWRKDSTWERIHDNLHVRVRLEEGREEEPSAGIIDSQSVKATEVRGVSGL
jgi:putative transposase